MFRVSTHVIIYIAVGVISTVSGALLYNMVSSGDNVGVISIGALSALFTLLFLFPAVAYSAFSKKLKNVWGFLIANLIYGLSLPAFFAVIMSIGFDWTPSDRHTSFLVFIPVLIMGILSFVFHIVDRKFTLIEYTQEENMNTAQ